jgi:hypothetical protein
VRAAVHSADYRWRAGGLAGGTCHGGPGNVEKVGEGKPRAREVKIGYSAAGSTRGENGVVMIRS